MCVSALVRPFASVPPVRPTGRRWRPSWGRPAGDFSGEIPVDPKTCWISYGMVGGAFRGVLCAPVGEITPFKPASEGLTLAARDGRDDAFFPRLGGGGPLLPPAVGARSPSCCRFMELPRVGLLLTTLLRKASVLGGSVRPGRGWGSCNRDDHAARPVLAPVLPISVDPVARGISKRWMAERARGILDLPRARYPSNPQPLHG